VLGGCIKEYPVLASGLGRFTWLRPDTVEVPDVAALVSPARIRMMVDFAGAVGAKKPVTQPGRAVQLASSIAAEDRVDGDHGLFSCGGWVICRD